MRRPEQVLRAADHENPRLQSARERRGQPQGVQPDTVFSDAAPCGQGLRSRSTVDPWQAANQKVRTVNYPHN